MNLNLQEILNPMLSAAQKELGNKWPDVKDYADAEFKKLGESLLSIAAMRAENKITQRQAELLFDIQRNTARTVMLTVEGLGILAVEGAINAALGAVKDSVNTALGWTLL